jgi:hypothetical protein
MGNNEYVLELRLSTYYYTELDTASSLFGVETDLRRLKIRRMRCVFSSYMTPAGRASLLDRTSLYKTYHMMKVIAVMGRLSAKYVVSAPDSNCLAPSVHLRMSVLRKVCLVRLATERQKLLAIYVLQQMFQGGRKG